MKAPSDKRNKINNTTSNVFIQHENRSVLPAIVALYECAPSLSFAGLQGHMNHLLFIGSGVFEATGCKQMPLSVFTTTVYLSFLYIMVFKYLLEHNNGLHFVQH